MKRGKSFTLTEKTLYKNRDYQSKLTRIEENHLLHLPNLPLHSKVLQLAGLLHSHLFRHLQNHNFFATRGDYQVLFAGFGHSSGLSQNQLRRQGESSRIGKYFMQADAYFFYLYECLLL